MRVILSLLLLAVATTTTTSALRHPLKHYEEKFRAWIQVSGPKIEAERIEQKEVT